MTNPKPSDSPNKYFFYDDATRIVYYSEEYIDDHNLIYIGTSNNPDPKMAMAAFMQNGKINQGYMLINYDSL